TLAVAGIGDDIVIKDHRITRPPQMVGQGENAALAGANHDIAAYHTGTAHRDAITRGRDRHRIIPDQVSLALHVNAMIIAAAARGARGIDLVADDLQPRMIHAFLRALRRPDAVIADIGYCIVDDRNILCRPHAAQLDANTGYVFNRTVLDPH